MGRENTGIFLKTPEPESLTALLKPDSTKRKTLLAISRRVYFITMSIYRHVRPPLESHPSLSSPEHVYRTVTP